MTIPRRAYPRTSQPGKRAACAAISVMALLCAIFLPPAALAFTHADPSAGTTTLKMTSVPKHTEDKILVSAKTDTRTLYANGRHAYCLHPGVSGPKENQSWPAKRLSRTDFPSEQMWRGAIAALYYAPGGPGYESKGKAIFPDTAPGVSSVGELQRYFYYHELLAYYYAGGLSEFGRIPAGSYPDQKNDRIAHKDDDPDMYRYIREQIIPSSGWTDQSTLGGRVNALADDAAMLANGGYTFDDFASKVYLVMGGRTSSGYTQQDLLTFDGTPPSNGQVSLAKHSSRPDITDGNPCYSLKGAVYGVFKTSSDAQTRNRAKAVYVGTTGQKNADGTQVDDYFSTGMTLPTGDYWVTELSASPGYALDETLYRVSVRASQDVRVNPERGYVTETPMDAPIDLWLAKADGETRRDSPQGNAALSGAEFTIRFYAGTFTADSLPPAATRTWTVRTDDDGTAPVDESHIVSGSPLYRNASGNITLPLGTVTVVEAKPPRGYRLDSSAGGNPKRYVAQIKAEGGKATVAPVNYDGKIGPGNMPVIPDMPIRVGLKLLKHDALLGDSRAEGDAKLDGAVFSVVNDSSNPVMVGGREFAPGEECATITASRQGSGVIAQAPGNTLPFGDYIITEKSAPSGYLANPDWSARVTVDDSTEDGHVFDLTSNPCADTPIRGGIEVPKHDRELSSAMPLGGATLAGAEIRIALASDQPVVVDGNLFRKGDVVKTIFTRDDGTAVTGHLDLPYGTYEVSEGRAPRGYLPNPDWRETVRVRDNGEIYTTTPVTDQVKRGDVRFNKVSADDMRRIGGVPFLITSNTTGESHIAVTDENGSLDTSAEWASHAHSTNANDGSLVEAPGVREVEGYPGGESGGAGAADLAAAGESGPGSATGPSQSPGSSGNGALEAFDDGARSKGTDGPPAGGNLEADSSQLDPEAGIWFSGRMDAQTKPDDGFGALPYDTYTFRELRCKSNEGFEPVTFEVSVYRDKSTIDMGTVDDKVAVIPGIDTELADETGSHVVPCAEKVILTDSVTYTGLKPGETYTLKGSLMDKTNGEPATSDGTPIESEATFKAKSEDGEVDVTFVLDASRFGGASLVAFQELLDSKGSTVCEHNDLDDPDQTVYVPSIATTLTTPSGAKSAVNADGTVHLVDRVDYTNLSPGTQYRLIAQLHEKADDGSDGGVVSDSAGSPVTGSTTFTPSSPSGSQTVEIAFDWPSGKQLDAVAFESLSANGRCYAVHEDISDPGQTASITPAPSIEKYISKDVHLDLDKPDDTFGYDVMAYVTADAVELEMTDSLDDGVEFASGGDTVRVFDMGQENNHKTAGSFSEPSDDATVSAGGIDITGKCDIGIEGKTLGVHIPHVDEAGLRGHWIRIAFDCTLGSARDYALVEDNGSVLSDLRHRGIPNRASYAIGIAVSGDGTETMDRAYTATSNVVTVRPPSIPAIEKYVNKDVHFDLHSSAERFTYDILAYAPDDASSIRITDELVDGLEFAGGESSISVYDMGEPNNHATNGSFSDANEGATVSAEGTDISGSSACSVQGRKLTVTLDDLEERHLQGHWIRVAFAAAMTSGGEYAKVGENTPVLSGKAHEGIPNTASYTADVPNRRGPLQATSNTVTVHFAEGDAPKGRGDEPGPMPSGAGHGSGDGTTFDKTGNLLAGWWWIPAALLAALIVLAIYAKTSQRHMPKSPGRRFPSGRTGYYGDSDWRRGL